jgi:hypothetical protein
MKQKEHKMEKLVVTRHRALYTYLVRHNFVDMDTPCMSHADIPDVRDRHVFGVLPYWLASKCGMYTEIQMRIPLEKRGKELTNEDVEFLAIRPRTYKVMEIKDLQEPKKRRRQ